MGGEENSVKGNHSHRGKRPSGMGRRAVGVLTSALAALLLFAATAQAAPPVTIAEFGEGVGEVSSPVGVAVDQSSGDLYVADRNNFRISRFDSAGEFLLAWGWGVADGTSQEFQTCGPQASPPTKRCFNASSTTVTGAGAIAPEAVAVDQSSGDVYVADLTNRRVTKFSSSGEFLFMVGKGVNQGGGTPSSPGNLCTVQHLANGDICGIGTSGTAAGEFDRPSSLAIDAAGNVWVGDTDRLQELNPNGTFASEVALAGAGVTRSLALDSAGNFYVKSQELPGIRKLQAGTGTLLETLAVGVQTRTVTLDAADNVYVGHCVTTSVTCSAPPYRFMVFNPAGEQGSQFGAGQVIGAPGGQQGIGSFGGSNALVVADSAGVLYVASSVSSTNGAVQAFAIPEPGPLIDGQQVEDLLPTTATLLADLNPEGNETTYRFEYGTTDSYGQSTETKTLPGSDFDSEAVKAELTELTPDTTYHFRLVATNHCKASEPTVECTVAGPDTTFTTRPAVAIEEQWATGVAASSASLHAELDPLGVAGEWWIEYGTSPCAGGSCEKTAEAALPASFGALSVGATLTGLAPATTYHYRFAARDERDGTVYVSHGEPRTFTTQLGGLGFELPDDRAWEMVSPPNKFGGRIGVDFDGEGQIQAAEDGNALAYLSLGSIEADPEGNRVIEDSSVLSRRGAGGNWGLKDITPPNTAATPFPNNRGREFRLFSADLSSALLEPRGSAPLSPIASERTPYLRHNAEPPSFIPLVTGKEGFANVPPGTEFGGDPASPIGKVHFRGGNADLSRVVLESAVPLAAGAAINSLYEWTAGQSPAEQLQPVSIKPEGGAGVTAQLGSGGTSAHNAISEDGSRVFWSTLSGLGPNALYLRDMEAEETLRLDIVQPGALGSGSANPIFQGADAAGTVAFFTDTQQLTEDSGAASGKADLYRCEVVGEGGAQECALSNLTPEGAAAEAAGVLGIAPGISEDASRVYFVARGVLDPEPNAMEESAVTGQPNLYLWQEGVGIRFIATLSEEDEHDWGQNPSGCCFASQLSAAASPSGRYLAFMSQRSLSGYDNRDASSGEPSQEVFRYDAVTNELICASCNPTGARPAGLVGPSAGAVAFDPLRLWSGRALAAVLPDATRIEGDGISVYRSRAIHDNGRLFFNAADSLVPSDTNGNWDVYQYEPTGVGDCSASSGGAGVARSAGGCVALISSGTGEEEAAFLDASVGGDDVFFLSPAQLSVTDEDRVMDVYDARVDGVPATLTPRSECLGEACQPAVVVPDDPTPASAGFRGAGNVPPQARKRCPKAKRRVTRKGKTRCVSKRSPSAKRQRANRDGRAGR